MTPPCARVGRRPRARPRPGRTTRRSGSAAGIPPARRPARTTRSAGHAPRHRARTMSQCTGRAAPHRARTTARSAGRGPQPSHPRQQPTARRHRDEVGPRAGLATGQLAAASRRRTAAGARLTGSATRTRGTGPRRQPTTRLPTVSHHWPTVLHRPAATGHAATTTAGAIPARLAGAGQGRMAATCRASGGQSLARTTIPRRPAHGAHRHRSAGFRPSAGLPSGPAGPLPQATRNTGARRRSPPAGIWRCASELRPPASHRRLGRRTRGSPASAGTPGQPSSC